MSLPDWTAGIQLGRAVAGISTGEADFEQLDTALGAVAEERKREQDESEDGRR